MQGRTALWKKSVLKSVAMLLAALFVLSGCGGAGSNSNTPAPSTTCSQSHAPINIGISVSLSGDFSADGKYTQQGYQLWADTVNKSGGLCGRQVKLDFLSDASSTTQVATNYTTFITLHHDDLVLGPYSTLLTKPASLVAARYNYAFIEGSGGGPSVFTRGLHNIFDVSPPILFQMNSFAQYILSLPTATRPTTAAYATEDDPFTQPMVDQARSLLEAGGITSVSYQQYSAETTDFTPIAQNVINSKAQVVVLGSMLNDIVAEVQAFRQQHFNPQAIIASAGPDQGASFTGPIGGSKNAEGIFYPNAWDPTINTPMNSTFVSDFMAANNVTAQQISADSAEAYSVGEVLTQAVNKIQSIDNAAIIKELHSGDTFQSIQGNVKFDDKGENVDGASFVFQWQKGSVVLVYPSAQAVSPPEFPKPTWH